MFILCLLIISCSVRKHKIREQSDITVSNVNYIRDRLTTATIQAVTGLVKLYEKDTGLRKFLKILGKNHCEEAITEMQNYYYNHLFKKS